MENKEKFDKLDGEKVALEIRDVLRELVFVDPIKALACLSSVFVSIIKVFIKKNKREDAMNMFFEIIENRLKED